MKKLFAGILIASVMYLNSINRPARVVWKLYEGYSARNDLYVVACGGWYMPLIADDLNPDDVVMYYGLTDAWYMYHFGK